MKTWLNLKDKIVIVTGGASGIGLAIVDELIEQGANVQMTDIHGGDKYRNGENYRFWPTDISRADEVNHSVEGPPKNCGAASEPAESMKTMVQPDAMPGLA